VSRAATRYSVSDLKQRSNSNAYWLLEPTLGRTLLARVHKADEVTCLEPKEKGFPPHNTNISDMAFVTQV